MTQSCTSVILNMLYCAFIYRSTERKSVICAPSGGQTENFKQVAARQVNPNQSTQYLWETEAYNTSVLMGEFYK